MSQVLKVYFSKADPVYLSTISDLKKQGIHVAIIVEHYFAGFICQKRIMST